MKKVFLFFILCWGLIASAQVSPGSVLALANSPAIGQANKPQRYVTVPEGVWFYKDFTVESWVYLYSREPWSRLFDFSNGIDQDNVFFAVSGKMDVPTFGCYGGTNLTLVDIPKQIPLKKWTHIAITVKDSTVIVYFDGLEVFNQKLPYLPSNIVRKQNYIGKSPWDNPALGDMLVDEFRVFNKARTVDEIRTEMGQHLGNPAGLVLYYDFDTTITRNHFTDKSLSKADGVYSIEAESSILLPASYTKKATSETGFDLQWNTQPNTEYKVLYSLEKSLNPAASSALLSTGAFSATNLPEGTKYFQIGVPDIYNENTLIPLAIDSIVQKATFPGNAYRCSMENSLTVSVQDNIRSVMFWAKISSQNYDKSDSLFNLSNVVGSKVFSSVYCNGKQMKWAGILSEYFPKDQWFAVYAEFNALFNGDITFSNKAGVTLIDQLALIPSTLSTAQIENLTHSTAMYANALATYNFDSPNDLVDKTPIAILGEKAINYFAQSKAVITPFMQQITQLSQTQMSASCDKVEAAVKYEFLTATNSAFKNATSKIVTTNSLSFDKPDGDTVFVRVRSITATDTSEWSTMKYILIYPFPGHALALDGAGSYVTMPTNNWLGGSFTVECWVYLPNYSHSWARLFELGNGPGSNNILFALTDGYFKNQSFSIRRKGDILWEPQIPVNIPVGEWTHVAITLDSTGNNTGTVKIYYNGKIVLNTVCPNLPSTVTRTVNYIGNSSWANEPTEAKIDEFRMYDYAVPQDSIIARMHKPLTGTEKGLKLYYSFDDRNTLPLLTDLSNNAQTGILTSLAAVIGSDAALVPIIRKTDTLAQQKKLQIAWDKIPAAKHYELQLPTGEIQEVTDTVAFVPYGTLYTNRFQVRAVTNTLISGWSSGMFVDKNIERPNNAYRGVETQFDAKNALQLAASDSLTVMAWVKGFSTKEWSSIFRQRNEGVAKGTVGRAMYIKDNQLVVGYDSYGNGWEDFTCPMVMDSSQWNHVAYSVADGGVMRLYVNGVRCKNVYNYIGGMEQQSDSLLTPVRALATKSSDPFVIKFRTSANFLIDNLQLYNATLSESEIRELSHQSPSKTKKLIAGFDFNQESGTLVTDIAGNTSMSVLDDASTWKSSTAQYSTFIRTTHSVSDSTIGFAWDTIPGATEYDVQYSTNENFASPTVVTVTRSSVVLEKLPAATMHYARVRARISATIQSQWSAIKQQATTSLYDSLVAYYPIYGDKFASYFPPTAALFSYDTVKDANNRFAAPRQAIHLGTKDKAGMLLVDGENVNANNLAAEFTCALWFNADSVKNGTLLSKADFTNNLGYAINLLQDGTIGVVSMNGVLKPHSTSAKYKPHQWNFLVVSRNADGMLSVLLNDVPAMTPVKCDVPAKNTALFGMGDALSNPDVFRFIGSIDDVRLYTRALSKGEMSRLYHEYGWPYLSVEISNKTVTAQKDAGQTVGTLSTRVADGLVTDPQYTYQLVGGVGSSDNSKFTIAGNVLKTAAILDAQQQTKAFVRVKCTNTSDNQSVESALEITINDSVLSAVYDFEKLSTGLLDKQNGWQTVPHLFYPEGQIFVGVTDKSNTISPSIESFYAQTRNSIDSLFTDLRIHNDLHAQYSLSFDVTSTGMGSRFSVLSGVDRNNIKANNEILSLVLFSGSNADSVLFAGRVLTMVNQIPNTAKVQVIFSDLDRTTAHITVRAQALNQPDASWLPIVVNAAINLDTAKNGAANPANWNGVFCGLELGGWLDNIAIEKRPMNPNRSTMNADLLVHYPMDRTDSLIDVSQNKLDASLFSTTGNEFTFLASDRFNSGLSVMFNAQASYRTPVVSDETNFDEICISAWASVYNIEGAQQQSIVMLGLDTAINAYVYNKTINFVFGGKRIAIDYPSDVDRAAWNHFVFVSSKKENRTAIYLNGRMLVSVGGVGSITKSAKRLLYIGGGFNGAIDDIRIFGRLLNQPEITALYTEGGWPVQRISLTDRVYLQANQIAQLPVSVYPANAPTDKLIYSVANPAIAIISNTGLITAGDVSGVTTVNVSTINGSVTAIAVVEVLTTTISPITEIAIVGNKSEMLLNGSVNNKLSYTIKPKIALTTDIAWASSNEAVASIAADGMVTAKTPGTSYIYLYANKDKTVKDSFLLVVRPSAAPSVSKGIAEYKLLAIVESSKIAEKDTAIVNVEQFFADDDSLSFTFAPESDYTDSLQVRLLGTELRVYQRDTLVQLHPQTITITATDKDGQSASKVIEVKALALKDTAPIVIGQPKFDALYQFRKTASINLRSYIADDYTPFERLKFDTIVASNNDTAWIKNGVLTLNVRPQKIDIDGNVSFYVFDAKKHATQVSIPYSFKRVTNMAPKVNVVESLTQTTDVPFEIDLSKSQTTDDYTPLSKLLWSVDKASNVNVVLNGTILQLSASSSAWSGSEKVIVRATDEAGAIGSDTIVFTQTVSVALDGVPQVDFDVKLEDGSNVPAIVAKGTKLKATMIDKSNKTIAVTNYKWVLSGAKKLSNSGSADFSFVCDSLGKISVKLIAENGSGETTVRHSNVATVVGLSASSVKVCSDSSVVLSVNDSTAGTSIVWTDMTEASAAVKVTPSKITTYKVTVTKAGAKVEDQVTVRVLETPKVFAKDTAICSNLTVELSNNIFTKVLWNNATTTAKYVAKPGETVTVQAWVIENCPVLKDTIVVTSKDIPVTELPAKFSLCDGVKDTLVAKGGVSYAWSKDNVTNDSLVVEAAGKYYVTVTAANNCKTVDSVDVRVGNSPKVTAMASETKVCEKGIVKLWVDNADAALLYRWNTTVLADSTATATALGNNDFFVTATNEAGCKATDSVRVIGTKAPVVSIAALPNDSVCRGETVSLAATGGTNYKWSDALGEVAAVNVTPTATKTYLVTITNEQCTQRDTVRIVVHQLPIVTATPSKASVCRGAMVSLNGGGAKSYAWSNSVIDAAPFKLAQTTTFSVTGTDANGCKNTAQASVKLSVPYREQLGVVTYDSATGKKLIVAWAPTKSQGTASYVLYRLNDKTAMFDSLKRFSPSDSSCYFDTDVEPLAQSYTYKLVTRDSACNDTAESRAHTSVRLTASLSTDVKPKANLSWNLYGGMAVEKYHVLVYDASNKPVDTIDRVKGPNDLVSLDYSYDKHEIGYKYRIAFDLPSQVVVSKLKSDSGPFSQSLSNMSEASLVDQSVIASMAITASPNPATDILTISGLTVDAASFVTVTDSKGQSLKLPIVSQSQTDIVVSVKDLAAGLYVIQIATSKAVVSQEILVVR